MTDETILIESSLDSDVCILCDAQRRSDFFIISCLVIIIIIRMELPTPSFFSIDIGLATSEVISLFMGMCLLFMNM